MKIIFSFILISALWIEANAQTIKSMSVTICDSIKKIEGLSEDDLRLAQLSIYHQEMIKYPTLKVDITGLNRPREFNEYNYKINRELLKTCPEFIDQFSLLPLSKILDVEALFNSAQYDSLEAAIVEFIYLKKMDLVVVSIDEVYPYDNVEEFALAQMDKLKIGARYERGGIIIVLSEKLGESYISLNNSTHKFLSESEFNDLIDLENLKNITSFQVVLNCIIGLKSKV